MNTLTLAIALLCAWSSPNCQTLQHTVIVRADPSVAAYSWYDAKRHIITVTSQTQQPAIVGALLAHETENALGDWSGGLTHCVANETAANVAEQSFWQWFTAMFGPPANLSSYEWAYTRNISNRNAVYECSLAHM